MLPQISVIMPVYNASEILPYTMDSILRQTFTDFELICIDDESSDDTVAIVKKYAENDDRIVLLQKKNGGTAALSVIHAIPYVKGEYYFFTSHDDLFSPDLLARMWEKTLETKADCILPDTMLYYGENNLKNKVLGISDKSTVMTGRDAFVKSLDWTIAGNGLHRSSVLRKYGNNYFGFSSDEYLVRVSFLNARSVAFSAGTFFYRQVENSITRKISPLIFEHLITEFKLLKLVQQNNFTNEIFEKQYRSFISALAHYNNLYLENKSRFSSDQKFKIKEIIKNVRRELSKDNSLRPFLRVHGAINFSLVIDALINKYIMWDALYYALFSVKLKVKKLF